jgi:hypothetical protein
LASDSLFKVLLLDAFVRANRRVFLAAFKRPRKSLAEKIPDSPSLCSMVEPEGIRITAAVQFANMTAHPKSGHPEDPRFHQRGEGSRAYHSSRRDQTAPTTGITSNAKMQRKETSRPERAA